MATTLDTRASTEIGLREEARRDVAVAMERLLADTAVLQLKTQNYHWNVTGPLFQEIHLLTEKQYEELAQAMDEIAERIRALGHPAPATHAAYLKLTGLLEDETLPEAEEMLRQLDQDHMTLLRTARRVMDVAEQSRDHGSVDLLGKRIAAHEKHAWMLRSHIAR